VKIFLIRHTHASDPVPIQDEHRFLTATGRRLAHVIGHKMLAEKQVAFDAVLTSPLVRAVQTAELVAAATGYRGVITSMAGLMPGSSPAVAARRIVAFGGAVAVVGHEPTLGMLGAYLLGRPGFPPFRKGQVCLIENGEAVWTLLPDTLDFARLLIG